MIPTHRRTLRRQQSGVSWRDRDTLAFQQPGSLDRSGPHTLIDTKPHTHTCPCGGWHQPETTAYTILTHFNKIFVYMVIVPFFCLWVAWWVGFRHRRIMFKWLFSSLFFFFFLEDFVKCLLLKVQTKYLLSVTLNQTFFFPNLSSIKKYFCFFNKKQTYWYCFFPLCINTQVCSFM